MLVWQVTYSLLNSALYLEVHQKRQVTEMTAIVKDLESTAVQLQEHLKFNHTSLKNAVEHLVGEVQLAQEKLLKEGRTIVTKVSTVILLNFLSETAVEFFN